MWTVFLNFLSLKHSTLFTCWFLHYINETSLNDNGIKFSLKNVVCWIVLRGKIFVHHNESVTKIPTFADQFNRQSTIIVLFDFKFSKHESRKLKNNINQIVSNHWNSNFIFMEEYCTKCIRILKLCGLVFLRHQSSKTKWTIDKL